ncbi:MAG: oligosaccharide flippase family protein, partial [Candidatus Theseobacter exili]|nr:oligosaccharide flippase family protein [Candidatus Theseobacter exili]
MNERKAGLILSYVSLGIGNLISLFYTPVMLRLLGQSEYGLYSLVGSIIGYLGLLNFGFGGCYIRFYSRYNAKHDEAGVARLNGMFLVVYLLISLLVVASGTVLTLNADHVLGSRLLASELDTAKILMG